MEYRTRSARETTRNQQNTNSAQDTRDITRYKQNRGQTVPEILHVTNRTENKQRARYETQQAECKTVREILHARNRTRTYSARDTTRNKQNFCCLARVIYRVLSVLCSVCYV